MKNLLVFVPLVCTASFHDAGGWEAAAACFAAFCCVASAIYLLNDIGDLAADRAHSSKARRPFASGAVPISWGLALVPSLFVLGGVFGWTSGAARDLALYVILSLAYNFKLKEMPLVDVFVLAALYTVRLFGGGEASGYPVSLWLLGFASFCVFDAQRSARSRTPAGGAGVGGVAWRLYAEDVAAVDGNAPSGHLGVAVCVKGRYLIIGLSASEDAMGHRAVDAVLAVPALAVDGARLHA